MDDTGRKITKIAREVSKFTVQTMKEEGIGTAEFDFIHLIRHNPGITQAEVREQLKIDKGAAARRAASLEAKGYLIRKPNPADGRSQLLYATDKAENLKNSKANIESMFYEWLLAELPKEEKEQFCETLDKLYWRSKNERRAGFVNISEVVNLKNAADKKED
ncbi:MAG: helix-turn-helix domain-containing protein [Clostridia bacterium]|nr:MarR family transcriptional regulator [[Bacteroides] pectinophilus]MDD5871886.1 helix-turn-helix domain-containing protein [Clostridia bacterium]